MKTFRRKTIIYSNITSAEQVFRWFSRISKVTFAKSEDIKRSFEEMIITIGFNEAKFEVFVRYRRRPKSHFIQCRKCFKLNHFAKDCSKSMYIKDRVIINSNPKEISKFKNRINGVSQHINKNKTNENNYSSKIMEKSEHCSNSKTRLRSQRLQELHTNFIVIWSCEIIVKNYHNEIDVVFKQKQIINIITSRIPILAQHSELLLRMIESIYLSFNNNGDHMQIIIITTVIHVVNQQYRVFSSRSNLMWMFAYDVTLWKSIYTSDEKEMERQLELMQTNKEQKKISKYKIEMTSYIHEFKVDAPEIQPDKYPNQSKLPTHIARLPHSSKSPFEK
ncbi:hypothetical protein RFI_06174 [Reticulomyxa filosa]|uniref:Uncharacterized protein n=1 Tax=Reticulomyxa filosa TaxID=46433 RepID=X6NXB7_RETFI|nr:hypothetical protein RFI_06174 [Reticulomyxa filosa]|eukprot:ETO30945.1 hypothetical protein RFI_06174 [Reticulomyxa filosa]